MHDHRTCTTCREAKPPTEFYVKRRRGRVELNYECKTCCRTRLKACKDNPNRPSRSAPAWRRRITPARYAALLASQGNRCAICRGTPEDTGHAYWHLDHCHATGEVRGILCSLCNCALGGLRDSPALLRAAVDYLEAPPARQVPEPIDVAQLF